MYVKNKWSSQRLHLTVSYVRFSVSAFHLKSIRNVMIHTSFSSFSSNQRQTHRPSAQSSVHVWSRDQTLMGHEWLFEPGCFICCRRQSCRTNGGSPVPHKDPHQSRKHSFLLASRVFCWDDIDEYWSSKPTT